MTQAAAFQACYADWRLIKTRKVVQIILEVPTEDADLAYQVLGGMPNFAESKWVGVAALQPNLIDPGVGLPPGREADGAQPRKVPAAAPASRLIKLAGMACNEPLFWKYLMTLGYDISGDDPKLAREQARSAVHAECKVNSRKEFIEGTPAGKRWLWLYDAFALWRDVPDESR